MVLQRERRRERERERGSKVTEVKGHGRVNVGMSKSIWAADKSETCVVHPTQVRS